MTGRRYLLPMDLFATRYLMLAGFSVLLLACSEDGGDAGAGAAAAGSGGAWVPGLGGGGSSGGSVTGGSGVDLDNPEPYEGTASGLSFSATRGVYNSPVSVTVTHPTATEVWYTLDSSDPRTSTTVLTAPLPLTLTIDPADTTHRYLAPGVVVRATAGGATAAPGEVVTHTYLFLEQVVELSPDGRAPGAQWPAPTAGASSPWEPSPSQVIDYGMDPDVTGSAAYASQMAASLHDLPSVSLVTDLPNLFDPNTGIYVNASEKGEEWERLGSFEVIHPDGRAGCQGNAGIRIRGGYSRTGENPKHAFRLIFRAEYGTAKLRFPLFGSEGEASFDKLDLRTSQNYSWAFEGDQYSINTMVRDVFSRDLQRALGRPYTRSRYYHLFLDGVYWGLFQSQERAESRYATSYFGGSPDDYDVVKADGVNQGYDVVAVDGTIDGWQEVWTLAQQGFANDANYYQLEGKGPDGTRDPALPVRVDIDNLIDYMLVILFTANFDGPVSKFFENQQPNNFVTIDSRVDLERGFVFFAHDNEHTLMPEAIRVGDGVRENRATIGYPGGATDGEHRVNASHVMNVTTSAKFHPQWLHHRLVDNAQYRQRFAARAQAVLGAGGPLAPEQTLPMLQARADAIELAIIAESARWGDAKRSSPRTRDDDWAPAVEAAKNGFLALRPAIFREQLQELELHP